MCSHFIHRFATPLLMVLTCCAAVPAQDRVTGYNEDLDLKGISFIDNSVYDDYGGAVYFRVNGLEKHTLRIGANAGRTQEMTRNVHQKNTATESGTPNSITFAGGYGSADHGTAVLQVEVDGANNNFNMNDPMYVVPYTNLHLQIDKTGLGSWNLYGTSDLTGAQQGTRIDIAEGAFVLGNGAYLNIGNTQQNDSLMVRNNAEMRVGNVGIDGAGATLRTSDFQIAEGGRLVLHKDLTLHLLDGGATRSTIAGTVSGSGGLILNGTGTLKYTGSTSGYSGKLKLDTGELLIESQNSFETTGSVELGLGARLSVLVSDDVPNIKAHEISINNTALNILGVYNTTRNYVILESDTPITGDFLSDGSSATKVNYLTTNFGFSDSRHRYEGTVELTWNSKSSDPENGLFDVDPTGGAPETFTVGVTLEDTAKNIKSLTKSGRGTLVLTKGNEYRGDTLVNRGTLKLTHNRGTGREGKVVVSSGAFLELDFDNRYDQQITGAGQVIKSGDDTVSLTNVKNNYTGGTLIQDGTLDVSAASQLGTGTITFSGGKLKVDGKNGAVKFGQSITASNGADAWFETVGDVIVTSTVKGDGGLRKTGTAKLRLTGPAAYRGDTKIEEGILSVADTNSLGQGTLILSDGVGFENTAKQTNDRNIELKVDSVTTTGKGVVFDVQAELVQSGDVSGRGKLIKTGEKKLVLSGENTFSGGIELKNGVVEFSSVGNLGTGRIVFDGGVLRNTAAVDNLGSTITMIGEKSLRFDTVKDLTITSDVAGSGGLTKTGAGTLTLTGNNRYKGATLVSEGVLGIDGTSESKITVDAGAALTGSGIIYNDVHFNAGSAYQWTFGLFEEDSPGLNVRGDVYLNSTVFRPVTAGAMQVFPDTIDNWTVLKYAGSLKGDGEFLRIDNSLSPFYDFFFDYNTPGQVTVKGYHRRDPRPLSDAVAMGITLAQRRAHRRAFEQIDRELQGGRDHGLNSVLGRRDRTRGQEPRFSSRLWADIYGRTTEYESSYHTKHPWQVTSFGARVGYTILSSHWLSLGVMAGVENPEMENYRDKVKGTDGYVGIYYGQRIYGMWEIKGYFGGGSQRYKAFRNDTVYKYRAKYHGDSFETSVELGRPVLLGEYMVRPFVGFNLEYAGQQGSTETRSSSEFRTYSDVSLTQVFVRVGLDVQKAHQRGETFVGISYSNMIGGQQLPSVYVYYPSAKSGTVCYGTKLGQNIFTVRAGGNRFLDEERSRSLFLTLIGDAYADREDGKVEFTASLGYDYRY